MSDEHDEAAILCPLQLDGYYKMMADAFRWYDKYRDREACETCQTCAKEKYCRIWEFVHGNMEDYRGEEGMAYEPFGCRYHRLIIEKPTAE